MRPRKPVRTKERYILDSIVSIFRGGHWVEDTVESLVGPPEDSTSTAYITVIGGQKFYEQALYDALEPFSHYIVGAGRGAESHVAKTYFDGEYTVIPVDQDRYGKNARKVNVEEVLCYALDSPLILVGTGERVKQARAWLDRTKSRREVIELP